MFITCSHGPTLFFVLSPVIPAHTKPFFFRNSYFNIILPSAPTSSQYALSFSLFLICVDALCTIVRYLIILIIFLLKSTNFESPHYELLHKFLDQIKIPNAQCLRQPVKFHKKAAHLDLNSGLAGTEASPNSHVTWFFSVEYKTFNPLCNIILKIRSRKIVVLCEISSSHGGSMMFRAIFWVVPPCKMIVDRRFIGAYCLHN
jgi:hypothetical protein